MGAQKKTFAPALQGSSLVLVLLYLLLVPQNVQPTSSPRNCAPTGSPPLQALQLVPVPLAVFPKLEQQAFQKEDDHLSQTVLI